VKNSPETVAILAKLHQCMLDVDRIEKDRKNLHGNYQYASEKVIKEVLHAVFCKNKVLLQIETMSPCLLSQEEGGKAVCMALHVDYRLHDVDTGQFIGGTFVGSGNGRDDKGIYAAVTGAIKYILTSNLLIPTGDDPESNFFDRYLDDEKGEKKADAPKTPAKAPQAAKEPKAEPKPVEAQPATQAPAAAPEDALMLTDKSRNAIIDAFEKVGIDIFDMVKHPEIPKEVETWNMGHRKTMLKIYTALTSGKGYSKEDFLAGKTL
jgi:hypothetical protein